MTREDWSSSDRAYSDNGLSGAEFGLRDGFDPFEETETEEGEE